MTARARRGSTRAATSRPPGTAIGEAAGGRRGGGRFSREFSVIIARWEDGRHTSGIRPKTSIGEGILRRSVVPCSDAVAAQVAEAREAALRIAEALGHVGVLTVEFFASANGPVVNEIAPRVHNSGHWTIEGASPRSSSSTSAPFAICRRGRPD